MNEQQLLDRYFIKNRVRLLDIAAFLDRLDRSAKNEKKDFRIEAFTDALNILCSDQNAKQGTRTEKILLSLSDPTTEHIENPKGKSASGAYNKEKEK